MNKYEIAAELRQAILSGDLIAGAKLPAVRSAEKWNIFGAKHATVARAYRILVDEGLLVQKAGNGNTAGTYVAEKLPNLPKQPTMTVTEAHERLDSLDADADEQPITVMAAAIHEASDSARQALAHAWLLVEDLFEAHDTGHPDQLLNIRYAIEAADHQVEEIHEYVLAA